MVSSDRLDNLLIRGLSSAESSRFLPVRFLCGFDEEYPLFLDCHSLVCLPTIDRQEISIGWLRLGTCIFLLTTDLFRIERDDHTDSL